MPITLPAAEVTDEHRPFLYAQGHADGTVTLYYPGDTLPVSPPAPPTPRLVSVQEFRSRFTDAELASIALSTDVQVRVLLLKLQTRSDVDLDDPQVSQGLDLLISKTLLATSRKAQILA